MKRNKSIIIRGLLKSHPNQEEMAALPKNTQKYFQDRTAIIEAFMRFENNQLQNLSHGAKLTIVNLCKEAEIDRNIIRCDSAHKDLYCTITAEAKPSQIHIRRELIVAIERIRSGHPKIIELNQELSLSSYAHEAGVSAGAVYRNCYSYLREIIEQDIAKTALSKPQRLREAFYRLQTNNPTRVPKNTPIACFSCCREAGIAKRWSSHPDFIDINNLIKSEAEKQKVVKRSKFLFLIIERFKNGQTKNLPLGSKLTLKNLERETHISGGTIHKSHPEIIEEIRKYKHTDTDDIWYYENLGLEGEICNYNCRLCFKNITQPWLKGAAKQYTTLYLHSLSPNTLNSRIIHLNIFSKYLKLTRKNITPNKINRQVIEQYLKFIGCHKSAYRQDLVITLRHFLQLCTTEEWLKFGEFTKVYDADMPKIIKGAPRYIPEFVMQQLHSHIDKLEPIIRRLVQVLTHCGMRCNELTHILFDCLIRDYSGDYFLRYTQFKQLKEHTVPISKEIASIIQEQQKYVLEIFGEHKLLFPAPKAGGRDWHRIGKPMASSIISTHLNNLADKYSIYDETGRLWHFQTHQFRHTVGTRMINNGVPQHIVQKYLGHTSPEMTSVYAHIHDATMKKEFAKFQSKFVDIAGNISKIEGVITTMHEGLEVDKIDAQWMKNNILSQSLPNGICALPIVQRECPHANACLVCSHFRTDASYIKVLKNQLLKTKSIIQKAESSGCTRQVEINQTIAVNLETIIIKLGDSK